MASGSGNNTREGGSRARACEHNAEPDQCAACALLISQPFTFTYLRKGRRPPTPPKAYVPPIRYDENNPHLTSSDAQTLQGVVREQAARIERLTTEVTEVRKELEEARSTNREVSAFLNNEIVSKEQLGRKLESALDQRTKQSEAQARQLRATMQRQLKAQKAEFDVVELGLRRELAELREDNKQLIHFREQQRHMDQMVNDHEAEIARLKEELEKQDYDWHQRTRTTQGALETEYRSSLERARDEARVEARGELSEEVRVLIRQKATIERELDEQVRARDQYLKEREQLRAETAELRIEVSSQAEQLQDVQKQLHSTHRHNSELFLACKALKSKIESLIAQRKEAGQDGGDQEQPLSGRRRQKKQIGEVDEKQQGGVAEEVLEALKRDLEDKDRRLREIRKVARRLLNQRSMVETFLIDAIESCREQIFVEYQQRQTQERQQRLGRTGGSTGTPRGHGGANPAYPAIAAAPVSARGVPGHPERGGPGGGDSSYSGAVVPMPPLPLGGGMSGFLGARPLQLEDGPRTGGMPEGLPDGGGAFMTGMPDIGEGADPSSLGPGFDAGAHEKGLALAGAGGGSSGVAAGGDPDFRRSIPLSKLSWRQREQILKMLFKKINEEGTTSTWKLKNKLRSL